MGKIVGQTCNVPRVRTGFAEVTMASRLHLKILGFKTSEEKKFYWKC